MLTHLSRGLTSTVDQAKSLSPHGDALFVDLPFFIAMSPRSKRQLSPRDMPLDVPILLLHVKRTRATVTLGVSQENKAALMSLNNIFFA